MTEPERDRALNRALDALEPLKDARGIAERSNQYLLARAIYMVESVLRENLNLLALILPYGNRTSGELRTDRKPAKPQIGVTSNAGHEPH